jgi:hypothetical protein
LQTTTLLDAIEEFKLMLVLVVLVEMKKKRELKNVFSVRDDLVSGMKKTNVQNYLIYW